ncbi:hypothetical protein B0T24DRAFT_643436 [Lasiosphaeria ovina]|uniref:F-box domain-containing protein n=1 Tax=Lasiosphaeria ovina TaxID=92902 RepID=A0AAE0JT81_9PEZI|nr:hypothetical protein B0T24DRAFT_643436 [Lasiosphaeria ovina]
MAALNSTSPDQAGRLLPQTPEPTCYIRKLPSELLRDVFSYLQETDRSQRQVPNREIQNLRLVCRGFYDMASYMLLPALKVNISSSSLERLGDLTATVH